MDFFARDFARDGHEVFVLPGFGAWRQDFLNAHGKTARFRPDATFVVDIKRDGWSQNALDAIRPVSRVFTPPLEILAKEIYPFRDEKMARLAAFPFSLPALAAMEDEFKCFLAAERSTPFKILAIDADNTLWAGLASEGDVAEIAPLQKTVLALKERGAGLVLLSKNNLAPVVAAFAPMTLSPSDFLLFESGVNYRPKAENLRKICDRLDLSPDSVVFVDDRPFERDQMKAYAPEVTVPPFGLGAAQLARRLETYFFPPAHATREDGLRNADYAAREKRADLKSKSTSEKEFLRSLEIWVEASDATPGDVPRLSQMSMRTNQFNATTKRRSEEEFAAILQNAGARVFCFRSGDRFGDMGLVCYVVAKRCEGEMWRITDFVMSCRAMGRHLEDFALDHVKRALAGSGAVLAGIDFEPSSRNQPFAEWLASRTLEF